MTLRPAQVNIKAVDTRAVGRFWAEALGWTAYDAGVTTYVGPTGGLVWPIRPASASTSCRSRDGRRR